MEPVYFDYNATTPIAPEVVEAMIPYLTTHHGNPSSSHAPGRKVRAAIDHARSQVADMIGASPEEIIFSAGGSESNNHAIKGAVWHRLANNGGAGECTAGRPHLIISAVEHPCVTKPAHWLASQCADLTVVPVDNTGMVNPEDVRRAITPQTILISVMLANNEVGTIQPIAEIAAIAHDAGILMHTDAAQAVGKVPVRVDKLSVDLLSIAGHKFHAPPGIGALYVREGVELSQLIQGAGHEKGRRAGTENVAGIVGLGTAAAMCIHFLADGGPQRVQALRDQFHEHLAEALGDRVRLNGHAEKRLPNTLNLGFRNATGPDLLAAMPDLCASSGAACHSSRQDPSAVLAAMEVPRDYAIGSVRFSFGRYNTAADIERALPTVLQAMTNSE